jgi:hypothetical protein
MQRGAEEVAERGLPGAAAAPVGGESDITELYVARYGKLEPGKRVFIRTRQQREG